MQVSAAVVLCYRDMASVSSWLSVQAVSRCSWSMPCTLVTHMLTRRQAGGTSGVDAPPACQQ